MKLKQAIKVLKDQIEEHYDEIGVLQAAIDRLEEVDDEEDMKDVRIFRNHSR